MSRDRDKTVIPVRVIRHRRTHRRDRITVAVNRTRKSGAESTILIYNSDQTYNSAGIYQLCHSHSQYDLFINTIHT